LNRLALRKGSLNCIFSLKRRENLLPVLADCCVQAAADPLARFMRLVVLLLCIQHGGE
jgi:hypothetical protein